MKANFIACQDHLHANNLLKRNQRRKEQELGATQQSEKIYCDNEKLKCCVKIQWESLNIKALRKLLEQARKL